MLAYYFVPFIVNNHTFYSKFQAVVTQ